MRLHKIKCKPDDASQGVSTLGQKDLLKKILLGNSTTENVDGNNCIRGGS
jgi:hypothetical protein